MKTRTYLPCMTAICSYMILLGCLNFKTGVAAASPPVATVFVANAFWLNTLDHDFDGYWRSGELWFDPNCMSGTVVAYAKILGKPSASGAYTLYRTTPSFIINGLSNADKIMMEFGPPNPEIPHGIYDIRIEIYQVIDNILLTTYGVNQDADLNDRKMEMASEDPDPYLQLTYPNGYENLVAGNSYLVTWAFNFQGKVDLELYKSGSYLMTIVNNTACDGSHLWTFPPTLTPGSDYQVYISSPLAANLSDLSDNAFTISNSNINIIKPNGGEAWIKGLAYEITWFDQITENVRIDLLRDGSQVLTIASSTPSDGSFFYTPPASLPDAATYRIRIRSVSNSSNEDISDNDFSINGGQIVVTSPNGGEQWLPGSTHLITWNDNIPANVKIQLYGENGLISTLTSSTPSDGEFSWKINNNMVGNDLRIKITSVSSSGTFDYSDAAFSVGNYNALEVISPNGGEQWAAGTSHDITWSYNITNNVKIELFKGGNLANTLASSTPCNGSFTWSIPSNFELRNDYSVKITSVSNSALYDWSNAAFAVVSGGLDITSPNGSETWLIGTSHEITWTDAISESVKIQLYKSGTLSMTIASSTVSDGSYNWYIPSSIQSGSDYTIKITSVANPAIHDESDTCFSLNWGSINLISPNGSETYIKGGKMNITWTDDFEGNVSIKLYKNGTFHSTISSSTPSDGLHQYNIPSGASAADSYKVRIAHISDPNTYDMSDDDFSIITGVITVTYPNGYEEFESDTTIEITWTDNFPGPVKIELYREQLNLLIKVSDISDSTDSDGSFTDQLSVLQGGEYKIKVSAYDNDDVYDFSDETFHISSVFGGKLLPNSGMISFANPAGMSFNFSIPAHEEKVMVTWFDLAGRCMKSNILNDLSSGEHALDVADLPEGIYLVSIMNRDQLLLREKVVVVH